MASSMGRTRVLSDWCCVATCCGCEVRPLVRAEGKPASEDRGETMWKHHRNEELS